MLISNGIKCECFFPYGGIDRGVSIKSGEFSKQLPSSRFLNKLLHKDWIKGVIRVYLTKEEITQYKDKLVDVVTYEIKEGPANGLFLLSKGPQAIETPVSSQPDTVGAVKEPMAPSVTEEEPPKVTPPVEVVEETPIVEEKIESTTEETQPTDDVKEKKTRKKRKQRTEE